MPPIIVRPVARAAGSSLSPVEERPCRSVHIVKCNLLEVSAATGNAEGFVDVVVA
jgi:hypothetical protein